MNETYVLWLVLTVVGVYFIFFKIIPFIRKARKMTKGIFSKIYIDKTSTITQDQYRKIAIGAIYSEQQTAWINALSTGLHKGELKKLLSEWWGINDKAEAVSTLDYLKNKGFRYYFPTVYQAFLHSDDQQKEQMIYQAFSDSEEDMGKAFSQLENLEATWNELTENNIVKTKQQLEQYGNVGWDCGRLTYVTRMCYDAGFISENESWAYINASYDLAIQHFRNWEDYSKSYVIGRSMWGGLQHANLGIIQIAEYLLKEEKSPWVNIKLIS